MDSRKPSSFPYKRLFRNPQTHGYAPVAHRPDLWTHSTMPTTFTLAVNEFGMKFFAAADATNLLNMMRKNYFIIVDPSGRKYCGLTIKWNYPGDYVDISMPNSVRKSLERCHHPVPTCPQHAPHKWLTPTYGPLPT